MKKLTAPILIGLILVGSALIAAPFLLWGESADTTSPTISNSGPIRELIVYTAQAPDGRAFDNLARALVAMQESVDVGSAVASSAVQGGGVIIAKSHDSWRTIPPGVLFLFEPDQELAEVFLDRAEFDLYLQKNPELARTNPRALPLAEFFRLILNAGLS